MGEAAIKQVQKETGNSTMQRTEKTQGLEQNISMSLVVRVHDQELVPGFVPHGVCQMSEPLILPNTLPSPSHHTCSHPRPAHQAGGHPNQALPHKEPRREIIRRHR